MSELGMCLLQGLVRPIALGDVHQADQHAFQRGGLRRKCNRDQHGHLSPFKVRKTVSDSKKVRLSAMATSTCANTSSLSDVNMLCSETSSSSLRGAASRSTVASLTSMI